MKSVVVFPERCIGCMQCVFECAVAHSQSKNFNAICEKPLPKPRIHVYSAKENYAFPSKCRHCEPTPCLEACPTSAIKREEGIVFVDVERCINCGMCVMVCPFAVIRFHLGWRIEKLPVSYKCDGCIERVREGEVPACVEACKVGALRYGDVNELIKEAEKRIASSYSPIFERKEEIPENYKIWLELRR